MGTIELTKTELFDLRRILYFTEHMRKDKTYYMSETINSTIKNLHVKIHEAIDDLPDTEE